MTAFLAVLSCQAGEPATAGQDLPAGVGLAGGGSVAASGDDQVAPANPGVARYLKQPVFSSRQERAASQEKVEPTPAGSFWGRALVCLAILAALLYAGLAAAKRFLPNGRQLFHSQAMEILGRTHLDPRRYVALVRVGRRLLVIGVSQEGMTALGEVADSEEVTELLEVARPRTEAGLSLFARLFQRSLKEEDERQSEVEAVSHASDLSESLRSLQALRERVRARARQEAG